MDIPLHKGNGMGTDTVDNYRISLMSSISKIFEKAVCVRLETVLNRSVYGNLQGAAQYLCSSMNTALLLRETVAPMSEKGHTIYIAKLDVKSAFDTIWHDGLLISKTVPARYKR